MSVTRIAILGLAIGAALLAAFLAKGFLGKPKQQQVVKVEKVDTVEILVAGKDVRVGGLIERAVLQWQKWPKEAVRPGMVSRKSSPDAQNKFENARARSSIFQGEPLSERKLVLAGDHGFMAALLPKGMRAIAVRVSVETGAGGFILPNDRVDVLLTKKSGGSGGANRTYTETVLMNVRILAIDQAFAVNEKGEKIFDEKINTATLELDPRQAEVVALAETTGQLTLALRSLADNGSSELGDDGPRLAEHYKKGGGGGEITIMRYGIPRRTATNE
jgi:pilus assembly protein CpaB